MIRKLEKIVFDVEARTRKRLCCFLQFCAASCDSISLNYLFFRYDCSRGIALLVCSIDFSAFR